MAGAPSRPAWPATPRACGAPSLARPPCCASRHAPLLRSRPPCAAQLRAQLHRQAEERETAVRGRRGGRAARHQRCVAAPPRGPRLPGQPAAGEGHLGAHATAHAQGTRALSIAPALVFRQAAGTLALRGRADAAPAQVDPSQCSLLVTEPLFNLPALMARRALRVRRVSLCARSHGGPRLRAADSAGRARL